MPRKRTTKKAKQSSKLTRILFYVGLLLILTSISWNFYQTRILSFSQTPLTPEFSNVQTRNSLPQQIIIPKFNIHLPIVQSEIKNGLWEVNPTGASHLKDSANPGEPGNIILYGHNKQELFGKTLSTKVGDEITLITQDQNERVYQVVETKIVNPTDVYILNPTPDETLTFYTCTGFLDSKRFVVIAKPRN